MRKSSCVNARGIPPATVGATPFCQGHGAGYPILTRQGGYPSPVLTRGYPILTWPGGTPSWPGQGVTQPVLARGLAFLTLLGGTQDLFRWRVPHPGVISDQDWDSPLKRTWDQWPGKEPGTGVPSCKGPRTSDLGKNLILRIEIEIEFFGTEDLEKIFLEFSNTSKDLIWGTYLERTIQIRVHINLNLCDVFAINTALTEPYQIHKVLDQL